MPETDPVTSRSTALKKGVLAAVVAIFVAVIATTITHYLNVNGDADADGSIEPITTTTVPAPDVPDDSSTSIAESTTAPRSTTTKAAPTTTIALPDPGALDAALLADDEFGQLEAGGWRTWDYAEDVGVIDPTDPDVCSGEPDTDLVAYSTFSGATQTGPNGYAGSLLASFKGDGAAQWFDEMLRMATNCGNGVVVNDQTGLAEVSDQSATIHIPEGTSGWHDLWDRDIVVFRRGPVIGMVAQMDVANSQGGLRALALVLAQRVATL